MAKEKAAFDPQALLAMPMDDIKPPAKMPIGSYVAVSPDYEFDKTKPQPPKEPTNLCRVKVVLVEAFPDVDQDQLKEALGDKALNDMEQRPLDFFLTEGAAFRFKDFIQDHCKIGPDEASNIAEGLEILKSGRQFGVEIGIVENRKNPENPYHQIVRTFALP